MAVHVDFILNVDKIIGMVGFVSEILQRGQIFLDLLEFAVNMPILLYRD